MTPPPLARRLVERAVPADPSGQSVVGDLQQEFDERRRRVGDRRARRWYWRQAVSIWWWSVVAHPPDSHHQPPGGVVFDLLSDLRQSARALWQARGQTAVIVGTLAVAIGATTVGFAFADLAVFRGLPVADGERAVFLFATDPRTGNDRSYVTVSDFAEYRARSRTTTLLSALESGRATLLDRGTPVALDVGRITADGFAVFGQPPVAGRLFLPGEDQPGRTPVVVLSHAYWTRVFAADPAILGQTLSIGGTAHTVIGVASPELEFASLSAIDAWLPLTIDAAAPRSTRRVRVLGRLRPDVSFATAAAEFDAIGEQLAREFPATNAGWRARLVPIAEATGGSSFWVIVALLSLAVGLVLAIACANVANILLVRAAARRRDVAIRAALGASRFRIVRQLLLEGVMLSAASAALAVPIGQALLRAIRSVDSRSGLQQLFFDVHELGFVTLVAVAAPLLFALVPALQLARVDVRGELAAGGARAGGTRQRSRSVLVVLQVALAAVLLCISGLAVRTAINIARAETGLVTSGVLKFTIELDEREYPDLDAAGRTLSALRSALAALPGVRAVGLFDRLPVIGGAAISALSLDGTPPAADGSGPWAWIGQAHGDSVAALGMRVLDGRVFLAEETPASAVALLGRSAAVKYFGGEHAALGRSISIERGGVRSRLAIVGIVSDVTGGDIERGPQPYLWLPLGHTRQAGFSVAASGDTESVTRAVRQAVATALPTTPVEELETYDAAIARLITSDLVIVGVMTGFAVLALLMAAIGLYGVVAYSAGQRRPEFGTRIALGATRRDIVRLVLGHAGRLLAIGLALGMAGGLMAAQAMRATLIGVGPLDPWNVLMVASLLAAVTVAASAIPAMKASRADLLRSLRAE